jgi:hypothetical protein
MPGYSFGYRREPFERMDRVASVVIEFTEGTCDLCGVYGGLILSPAFPAQWACWDCHRYRVFRSGLSEQQV